MESTLRRAYNAAYSDALYERYKAMLESEVGPIPYRLAETPFFAPPTLRDYLFSASREILEQLAEPARLAHARTAIPRELDVPGQDDLPGCMTIDFAVVAGKGGVLEGRVVELQAFPSLFAFSFIQAQVFERMLAGIQGFSAALQPFALGYDASSALALFREAVLAGEDPDHVVLLEIEPDKQKTRPDFVGTKRLLDIDSVCVTQVIRDGKSLFRKKDGRLVPIRRIYNRVVFDELLQKKPRMSFSFTDDLDVAFFPHPNWYWMWSKHSLPGLDHPAVPRATLVSRLERIPSDLERFVLKPLFSFAGSGVKVEPTNDDIAAIPENQRDSWILQEKIEYARELKTPDGNGVAAEIRILCLRGRNDRLPTPFMNLVRLSRGKMLGIDYNKDLDWVGSSIALWPV